MRQEQSGEICPKYEANLGGAGLPSAGSKDDLFKLSAKKASFTGKKCSDRGSESRDGKPEELLAQAAARDDLPEVLRLLRCRADANSADPLGETPLFEAVACENLDVVAALLLYAANVEHESLLHMTPWQLASSEVTLALLQLFSGKTLSATSHEAVLTELSESMRFLVERHLEPEKGEDHTAAGSSAASSCVNGNSENAATPLLEALARRDLAELCRLVCENEDVDEEDALGETPLFEAAAIGDADLAAVLLLGEADPGHTSEAGNLPEHLSLNLAVRSLIRLFRGVEVDAAGMRAVGESLCSMVRLAVAERLWGFDVSEEGPIFTPIAASTEVLQSKDWPSEQPPCTKWAVK
mmetsp:Transcript_80671/g.187282  ORF Transcript_80671/g.187282 Transcript_80671/m.187282 type:complete len:354 (-) Transcript_80671:82-1143(-)